MIDRTRVELFHLEGRIERWIRFGRHAEEEILDRRRRALWFEPGQVFAFVRWAANDYGTAVSRIDILRACATDEPLTTVPGVTPGGDVLLRISGWPKVERVLLAIDQVEALNLHPADACPDHWRHVHNRITADKVPRAVRRSCFAQGLRRRARFRAKRQHGLAWIDVLGLPSPPAESYQLLQRRSGI